MQRKDARCPNAFPMDAILGMPDLSQTTPAGALPHSLLSLTPNPPVETLVDGFSALGFSSPTPRYDASELFAFGYGTRSEDRWDCPDFTSDDGYEPASSLESDALTGFSDAVDGGTWYPRFHEHGTCLRMSGTGAVAGMISDPTALSCPGPSGMNWNDSMDSLLSRQVMRHRDAFCVDQGVHEIGNFYGYPQDFLRRNVNFGRSTGIDAGPWCSLHVLSRASIRDLCGRIRSIAKSRTGHKILLEKMKDMNAEEADIIFGDITRDLGELTVDPFASHVVQELIDVCSDGQRTVILSSITRNPQLIRICLDQYGALVIKKLLEILTPDWQKQEFVRAILPGVIQMTKNTNGHHLILHILKVFPADCNQVFLDRLNDKLYEITTDQHGCHVVIKHIQNVKGDWSDRMVAETVAHALTLSEHCYGNYVVQALLNAEMPAQLLPELHRQFMGSYSALACDKYASNVVEKCLARAEGRDFMHIICELLDDFLLLLCDEYANYVAQKMMARSKALGMPVYGILVDRIRAYRSLVEASIYGRKALERLKSNNGIWV